MRTLLTTIIYMNKIIKGYKAFNKGLTCQEFKYEVGKKYIHEGDIELCKKGFHFCENPLDTLDYYDLCESEFAEIETDGKLGVPIPKKRIVKEQFIIIAEELKAEW